MRAVLVSRYPRVDTPSWKRTVAQGLLDAGFEVAVMYSRAALGDQVRAGLRQDGLGIAARYVALRRGGGGVSRDAAGGAAQSLAAWAHERGVPVIRGRRLDDDEALDELRRLQPDLALLVGADIAPAPFLAIPRLGTLNAHYGLLPAYRGMNVTEWSVFNGDPVGVSVHMVDEGVDTGDVLLRERIPLERGETLVSLRAKHQAVAAELLVKAAIAVRDGTARPSPQTPADGRQYYRMHPRLREVAEARLRAQAGAASG